MNILITGGGIIPEEAPLARQHEAQSDSSESPTS